jgi:hypothetical protein
LRRDGRDPLFSIRNLTLKRRDLLFKRLFGFGERLVLLIELGDVSLKSSDLLLERRVVALRGRQVLLGLRQLFRLGLEVGPNVRQILRGGLKIALCGIVVRVQLFIPRVCSGEVGLGLRKGLGLLFDGRIGSREVRLSRLEVIPSRL